MKRIALLLVSVTLGLSHPMCHQALLVAPPGSGGGINANPQFIPAHGGVSEISVLIIEPAGTPVPDGTVVQFFTNLGRIQEQAKTNDGVARVNLEADGRSGTATVTAVSGGGTVPAPSPTATTTPTTTTLTAAPSGGRVASGAAAAASSALMVTFQVQVVIGAPNAASVFVSANPTRITNSRTSQIIAQVYDVDGNAVANVPVIFSVVESDPAPVNESFDSGGTPRFTDSNGFARDVLRTRDPFGSPQRAVTIRATTANGVSGEAVVLIN